MAEPFAQIVSVLDVDDGDTVGLGESCDEFFVFGIIAVVGQNTEESLLAVESLANLIEALDET